MAHFLRNGTKINVIRSASLHITEKLPAGNYSVKKDLQTQELFLEQVDGFTLPKRIYGASPRQAERIWQTFQDRTASTGVLLSGEKGSGKTMLAKSLSIIAGKAGLPTILINDKFDPDQLNLFLQSIEQPCVIFMDEFEKIFDNEHQVGMLTLLDGTITTRMLFILTCNNKYKINSHMTNRPGRIYYFLEFHCIPEEEIIEYCNENLKDKSQISKICQIAKIIGNFNFDQMKAIVEEMNRYREDAVTVLEMLNIKPENSEYERYEVSVTHKGKKVFDLYPSELSGSPMNNTEIEFTFYTTKDLITQEKIFVSAKNLKKFDPSTSTYTYLVGDTELVYTKKNHSTIDYKALIV
jgi:SpoVK/Ycf46/Vps4 family AAA+-type ATPase